MNFIHYIIQSVFLLVLVEASVTTVTVGTLLEAADWNRLNELNRI